MKKPLYILTFILFNYSHILLGQKPFKIDTINYYVYGDGVFHFTIQGNDTTCGFVNGKSFPIREYLRLEKFNCRLEGECRDSSEHIFFVHTYDAKGRLLFSTYRIDPEYLFFGPYTEYFSNGKVKIKGQYLFFGNDWEKYYDKNNWDKKVGLWTYYNKRGKIKKTINYGGQ